MSLFNLIPVLAGRREKETLQLIKEHAAVTYQVVLKLFEAFNAFEAGDYKTAEIKVDELCVTESKADDLRRAIEEKLYSGAFLPANRSLISIFAERVDEVADVSQDAAKLLLYLRGHNIPPQILALVKEEISIGLDTAETLSRSVSEFTKVPEIRSAINRIRVKEHESDEVENKAYILLYENIKDAVLLLLLSKLIAYSGNISDRAEDATDTLSLVLISTRA